MFAAPSPNPSTPDLNRRAFTFSPSTDEIGSQALPNEHTEKLCEILLTYGFYDKDLGKLPILCLCRTSGGSTCPAAPQQAKVALTDFTVCSPSSATRRSGPRLVCLGDIGYVQGMSDLCAPIYVIMKGEEVMTFWCFVALMERMVCFVSLLADPTNDETSRNKTSCVTKAG
jgi:hypothetical protein